MILKKIKLENITSHSNTEINFERGLNIFTGLNGTGKSTVLKMVGYVLFPSKSVRQKDLVRRSEENPKSGKVTLWIEGKDSQEYKIERGVGRSLLKVFDIKSGMVIADISNQYDYINWVKDQMDIHPATDIENLFKHAIGVDQGTFTAPFLDTPGRRKSIFAPLLNVEIYNQIWIKCRGIEKILENKLTNLEIEIEGYKGELKQKVQILAEQRQTGEKLTGLKNTLSVIQGTLKVVDIQYKEYKIIQEKLQKSEFDLINLKNSKGRIEESIKTVSGLLEESRKAEVICKDTKDQHDTYIVLEKEEKELITQEVKMRKIQADIEKLNQKLTQINTRKDDLLTRIDAIEFLKPEYQELSKKKKRYVEIAAKIEDAQKISGHLQSTKERRIKLKEEIGCLSKDIKVNEKKVAKLKPIEIQLPGIKVSRDTLLKVEKVLSACESEIARLEQNKIDTKNGKCPFLQEKCLNLGERSFSDYFTGLIEEKKALKVKTTKKLHQTSLKLKKLENLEFQYQELKPYVSILADQKKRLSQFKLDEKSVEKKLKEMAQQIKGNPEMIKEKQVLEPEIVEFNIIHGKISKELPILKKKFKATEENIKPLVKKIQPLEKQIESFVEIPSKLAETRTQRESYASAFKTYNQNHQIASKVPKYLDEKHNHERLHSDNLSNIEILEKEINSLKIKFDQDKFVELGENRDKMKAEKSTLSGEIKILTENYQNYEKKLDALMKVDEKLNVNLTTFIKTTKHSEFTHTVRQLFKDAAPKITEALLGSINSNASQIFRDLLDQNNVELVWTENYEVILITGGVERSFSQLSGGEQMLAALSVRLAILRVLSSVDFAFFDEPTTNLDVEKRLNLSKQLQNIRGFNQLFVISHDDTFQTSSEYIIHFEKDEKNASKVDFIQPS